MTLFIFIFNFNFSYLIIVHGCKIALALQGLYIALACADGFKNNTSNLIIAFLLYKILFFSK